MAWLAGLAVVAVLVGVVVLRRIPTSFRAARTDRAVDLQPAVARLGPRVSADLANETAGQADAGALTTHRMIEQQREMDASFDPRHDGWKTETLATAVTKQLKGLTKMLAHPETLGPERVASYVTPDFVGEPFRRVAMEPVFRDGPIAVRRAPRVDKVDKGERPATYRGPRGLCAAMRRLVEPFRKNSTAETHVKVYRVALAPTTIETTVDFELDGAIGDATIQHNATWHCVWTRPSEGGPRLQSLRVENVEETTGRLSRGRWFSDCTKSVLASNASFRRQIVYGLNHWIRRIERLQGMQVYARTGLAVGDVNGDGLDDIYLCQPGGLPNRLFVQNADGTATDRSAAAGVDWLEHTSSALLVDLDNDGDQDLALATRVGMFVLENDGRGRFTVRRRFRVDQAVESLSAADYDKDGDLDLYLCVYRANQGSGGREFLYHDANNGGRNHLFRNEISNSSEGEWRFRDVTAACGLDQDNTRWSLASAWEDVDNDGDLDLYVADDYGQNCLYRNDAGHFTNVARQLGVVDFGNGMSASWGDYDHDGWMDLYVGNMFSSAGNRIANQPRFQENRDAATRKLYRRFAKGNSLYRNAHGSKFVEVGRTAGVEMARWAWSSLFVDVDNDGWEDLFAVNGFITAEDSRDL